MILVMLSIVELQGVVFPLLWPRFIYDAKLWKIVTKIICSGTNLHTVAFIQLSLCNKNMYNLSIIKGTYKNA